MMYRARISAKSQKVFIVLAAISCILTSISWLLLLRQVYPGGQSNIGSVGMWTALLLPYFLFISAYLSCQFMSTRLDRFFSASALATVGVLLVFTVNLLCERFLYFSFYISSDTAGLLWVMIPIITVYLVFLLYLRKTYDKRSWPIEPVLVTMALVAFLVNSSVTIHSLVAYYSVGFQEPNIFPNIISALIPIILPLLFTLLAYFILKFEGSVRERIGVAIIAAIMGQMIADTLSSMYGFLMRLSLDMFFVMTDFRILGAWLSLAIYIVMLWWLRRSFVAKTE